MKEILFLVIICVTFCQTFSCEVDSKLGRISGQLSDHDSVDICEYLGIPFAEPPINSNRFKPPVPIQNKWNDTFNATDYGNVCMQSLDLINDLLDSTEFSLAEKLEHLESYSMSEDCLFLNIYSPNNTDVLLPVMVYIHGGDFVTGTGSIYKGTKLSGDHEVIVVNFNYRLGAFGFLYDGDTIEGNFGILDQKLAIQWVSENIQAFGGDPQCITIFGEGAGGSSVHLHTLTSDPLFMNAIVQNASYNDALWSQNKSIANYNLFVESLNKTGSDSVMGSNSTELTLASLDVEYWSPVMSHNTVTTDPSTAMLDMVNKGINIMSGSNRQNTVYYDNSLLDESNWLKNLTKDILLTAFPELYDSLNDKIIDKMSQVYLKFYESYETDVISMTRPEITDFIETLTKDQVYTTWAEEISYANSKLSNGNVYQYEMEQANEMTFIFGYGEENDLTEEMPVYWSNFAKSGNPNHPVNVSTYWELYNSSAVNNEKCRLKTTFDIDEIGTTRNELLPRNLIFWDEYYLTLGFSCHLDENDKIGNGEPPSEEVPVEQCEPTVAELFGLTMSNETAGILMFVFIALTSFFVLMVLICLGCLCHMKRKLKKACKKRVENIRGFDNPSTSECKL